MKNIVSIFIFFAFIPVFCQTHAGKLLSYSFHGLLTEQITHSLEERLNHIDFILQAKVRYKPEKQAGEILIAYSTEKRRNGENIEEFNPAAIKKLLSEYSLQPLEFKFFDDTQN